MASGTPPEPSPRPHSRLSASPQSRRGKLLPPPAELASYEQAYPGTAERILAMAEADQKAEIREVRFEQLSRFAISLLGQLFLYGLVGAAVFLAIHDKPLEAFFAGLGPIAIAIYANTRKRPDSTPSGE